MLFQQYLKREPTLKLNYENILTLYFQKKCTSFENLLIQDCTQS